MHSTLETDRVAIATSYHHLAHGRIPYTEGANDMGSQIEMVTYVRKQRRHDGVVYCDWCDYIFKVQGHEPEEVSIGITGGWHDVIPSLGRAMTDEELIAYAREFLEKEMAKGWTPSAEKCRLDIPSSIMEYRIQNGSFPG